MLGKLLDNRKRLLYVLAVLVGTVLLMGAAMMVMSKISDGQALVESRATEATTAAGAMGIEGAGIDDPAAHAAELFSCKVENLHDSAAVARLLTVMGIEGTIGKYAVQIAEMSGLQVLTLTTELPVRKNDEAALNANMKKYAQQMLILIPQVDRVEWIYSVEEAGKEIQASGEMDDAAAAEALGKAPDSFGKNERTLGRLLTQQAEL